MTTARTAPERHRCPPGKGTNQRPEWWIPGRGAKLDYTGRVAHDLAAAAGAVEVVAAYSLGMLLLLVLPPHTTINYSWGRSPHPPVGAEASPTHHRPETSTLSPAHALPPMVLYTHALQR